MFGPSFAKKVADEINKIREDPQKYSETINGYLKYFHGKVLRLPHESGIETQEGPDAYKEAAEFLATAPKLPPLTISPLLNDAANDMAKEMSKFNEVEEIEIDKEIIDSLIEKIKEIFKKNVKIIEIRKGSLSVTLALNYIIEEKL